MKNELGWIIAIVILALIGYFIYEKTQEKSGATPATTALGGTSGGGTGGITALSGTGGESGGRISASSTPGKSTTGGTEPATAAGTTTAAGTSEAPAATGIAWNTTDPDAFNNGNLQLAAKYLRQNGRADGRIRPDAAPVLKAPSSYYGQTLCFSGVVAAEDTSPDPKVPKILGTDAATEVVLKHADGTMLDYFLIGNPGDLTLGGTNALCGLPTGVTQAGNGPDKVGPRLVLVGKVN